MLKLKHELLCLVVEIIFIILLLNYLFFRIIRFSLCVLYLFGNENVGCSRWIYNFSSLNTVFEAIESNLLIKHKIFTLFYYANLVNGGNVCFIEKLVLPNDFYLANGVVWGVLHVFFVLSLDSISIINFNVLSGL